jgi:hypothetical protein
VATAQIGESLNKAVAAANQWLQLPAAGTATNKG